MQRRSAESEEYRIAISIIGWLYALALQCERAAFAPFPVRVFVLWMLRRGEAVVCFYAQDLAEELGYRLDLPEPDWMGYGPDDAIQLAYEFRALAAVLHMLAACVAELERAGEGFEHVPTLVSNRPKTIARHHAPGADVASLLATLTIAPARGPPFVVAIP